MQSATIPISEIKPSSNGRPVVGARVSALADSIAAIGLRTPITVRWCVGLSGGRLSPGYQIVAGRHRLEATKTIGATEIEAFVMDGDEDDAALWEIDENFARSDLTDAQRADHHVRREAILVRMGEVKTATGPNKVTDKLSATRSYASRAAADLGVDERTIRRDLRRGKNIAPDVLAEVAGTDMDKGVVLDALASVPQADQRAKLAEISLRRQEAERMRKEAETANRNTDRVIALTEAEQFADWIMARADLGEINTLIAWLEGTKAKDVIAALRRQAA